ncbi:hypothetical protein GOODEAATRI_024412, partial [Goodea atripinnis]
CPLPVLFHSQRSAERDDSSYGEKDVKCSQLIPACPSHGLPRRVFPRLSTNHSFLLVLSLDADGQEE